MNTGLGEAIVFNPDKDIARDITLDVIVRHRDSMYQAREGYINEQDLKILNDRDLKLNRVRGLYKVIAAQRGMISISRPVVRHNCYIKWNKKYTNEEDQTANPFEDQKNDYSELIELAEFLTFAELDLSRAETTRSKDDDYLHEKITNEGAIYVLTQKYYDLINDLEDTYEKIYLIMLRNKIVTAGIGEDEVKTYREQEEEAIRRVAEA